MDSLRPLFFKHLAQTSESPLLLDIDHAEGSYLFDRTGKKYLDLISGISVSNIGHSHPSVVKAVQDQAAKHMHLMVYGEYIQSTQVKLADQLCRLLPPTLQNVYYVNSGAEAVEAAMKLAKRYTGRSEVVSFINAYHGSTHGALSLMGNERLKSAYRPLVPNIRFLHFGKFEDLPLISKDTACVIIEPVQGEAGVIVPPEEYLEALQVRCNETKALLIFDEIQTGFGRTGKLFAFQHTKIVPDILLVAKAFGGGMPLGAFISSKEIMSVLSVNPPLGHITTFGGHPVSCAAGIAALNVLIEERLIDKVGKKEQLFLSLLRHTGINEIRSKGLLMALELDDADKVNLVIKKCLEKGLITDWFLFRDTALRIAPPLAISEDQIKEACKILLESIDYSQGK
jgi:acetylornithine/N-succinyldiaminopimelate aminotransferase